MRILIIVLFTGMLALSSCATTQKAYCPPKDVVILVPTPIGLLPIEIKKGFLDKGNEDDGWIGSEKYDKMMKEEKPSDEKETILEEEV